jgi:cbb3-type cytochrome oxidase subunit 3
MGYFIFVGDMLVMLFMMVLVVWVFFKSSDKTIDDSAKIPLEDEQNHG